MEALESSRQEVAEKLRAKYKERTMPGFFEPQDVYFQTLNYLEDLESCLPDGKSAFTVLADLIDPTCHMVDTEWDNGECTWGCICKECGSRFEYERAKYFNYCPHCGARVVSDDAKEHC